MRLVYFAPSDIQVARVDRQCIVSFCSALAAIGVDVTLVAIRIKLTHAEPAPRDVLSLYRIRHRFAVRQIRVAVSQNSRAPWLALNRLAAHTLAAANLLRAADARPVVLFTKTYSTALMLLALRSMTGRPDTVIFEAHGRSRGALRRLVLRRVDGVVANSYALADDLIADESLDPAKVHPSHQGVDLWAYESERQSKLAARRSLGLPAEQPLVVYTGKVYEGYEEIELLLAAARRLEGDGVVFCLVGGRQDHVDRLRARVAEQGPSNVVLTGFIPHSEVHGYQSAADVLVIYYPSGMELNPYRSPGKLFEYMAAARPIVAVDLPVLKEVLGDPPAARLVPADSPERLADCLRDVLRDDAGSKTMASAALLRVAAFTWEERARQIVAFIDERGARRRPAPPLRRRRGGRRGRGS